jgi:hypothetical protein
MNPILMIILLILSIIVYKGIVKGMTVQVLKKQDATYIDAVPILILSFGYPFFISFIGMLMINTWFEHYGVDFQLTYWSTFLVYFIFYTMFSGNDTDVRS